MLLLVPAAVRGVTASRMPTMCALTVIFRMATVCVSSLFLVNGVVGACVLGECNTQLILKGVARVADGYTVTCAVLDGAIFVETQNEPPAFLSVICMSIDMHLCTSCTIV